MATVLSVLQAGLAATEHQEFIQKLNENHKWSNISLSHKTLL
ncbi:MAG: hypothetical protein V7L29_34500 [Nostoc sp.]